MKLKLKVESREDLNTLRRKIPALKIQLLQWQAITIRSLVNEEFIDIIQQKMENYGFSKKIIDNTYIDTIDFLSESKIRIVIKSDYVAEDGWDAALHREKGTKDHFIGLKVDTARPDEGHTTDRTDQIRDIPDSKQTNHPKALHWVGAGISKFSKGHWVSGIPDLHIIENTIKERGYRVAYRYQQAQIEWYQKNLGGEIDGI